MDKFINTAKLRELETKVTTEEITYSKMVEIINYEAQKYYNEKYDLIIKKDNNMKNSKTKLSIMLVIALFTFSCSKEKHGKVVRDSTGNYYELDGNNAIGDERYLLRSIDINNYKKIDFDTCR